MSLELQNVAILSLEYQQPITPTPDITTPPGSASLQDDATDESSHEDPSQDSMEQSTERLRDRCLGDGFSNWCLVWGLWSALLGVGGSGLWLRSSVAASGHASSSSSDNGEGGTSSWRAQEDDTRSGLLLPLVGDNCEIQSSSSPRHKISALQLVLIAVDASPFSNVVTPLGDRGELRGPRVGDLGDDSTSDGAAGCSYTTGVLGLDRWAYLSSKDSSKNSFGVGDRERREGERLCLRCSRAGDRPFLRCSLVGERLCLRFS
mmetsp:Transcript_5622/g.12488  ORF Transcript_5622/g.12488 Transcript_5622/m.12488 type:complete len:262 (+) Transcript_5622:361-1146(+)